MLPAPHRSVAPIALLVGLAMLLLTGCSSGSGEAPDPVHVPGASTSGSGSPSGSDDPSDGSAGPASPAPTSGPVRIDLRLEVPESDATEAFAAYVVEHARSVIAGAPTARLREITSSAEYDRQVQVVGEAKDRGLTVPTRPQVAVVDSRVGGSGDTLLGVCLYLPSTEFVDRITGVSPAGEVPDSWVPAVATVAKETMTPVVVKLGQPDTTFAPDCGGLS